MRRFTRFRPRFARLHPRFVDSPDFVLHFYRNRIVARFRLRFVRFPSRFVDSRGSILYSSIREDPQSVRRFARFIPIRSRIHCEVPPSIRPEVPLSIQEVPRPRFVDSRCSALRSVGFRPRFVATLRPRFASFHPRFVGCFVLLSARFRFGRVDSRGSALDSQGSILDSSIRQVSSSISTVIESSQGSTFDS